MNASVKPKQLTPEEKEAWRDAVNSTWATIACDWPQDEKDPKPWVAMEVTLDADRVRQYGRLSKEQYALFNQWVQEVYNWKKTSQQACNYIGKELGLTLCF